MLHLATTQTAARPVPATGIARGAVHRALCAEEGQVLSFLRDRAVLAHVAPRVEPFHFCALIEANPHLEATAYADALMHVLPGAVGRMVLFRRPCAQSPSFDETWVLGILAACRRGDEASLRFALASRCAPPLRRSLGFLFRGLALRLEAQGRALP